MSPEQLSGFIGEMPGDDAADFVSMMEEDQADAILETLPPKKRYLNPTTAVRRRKRRGLMTPFVVSILKDQTVGQAIRKSRLTSRNSLNFNSSTLLMLSMNTVT